MSDTGADVSAGTLDERSELYRSQESDTGLTGVEKGTAMRLQMAVGDGMNANEVQRCRPRGEQAAR